MSRDRFRDLHNLTSAGFWRGADVILAASGDRALFSPAQFADHKDHQAPTREKLPAYQYCVVSVNRADQPPPQESLRHSRVWFGTRGTVVSSGRILPLVSGAAVLSTEEGRYGQTKSRPLPETPWKGGAGAAIPRKRKPAKGISNVAISPVGSTAFILKLGLDGNPADDLSQPHA